MLKAERFDAMRDGLAGLDTSLSSTADQVDKVGGYSYPVITFNGLKPNVENPREPGSGQLGRPNQPAVNGGPTPLSRQAP